MSVNAASRRVMEKVGMTLSRTFFADWPETIEGSELGDVEYALSRDDWGRNRFRTPRPTAGRQPPLLMRADVS